MTGLDKANRARERFRKNRSVPRILKRAGEWGVVLAAVLLIAAAIAIYAHRHFQRRSAINYLSSIPAQHRVISSRRSPSGATEISVFLQGTDVGDLELMQHVASIPEVQTLDLTGTQVTPIGLKSCWNLRQLQQLKLAGTNIDGSVWSYLMHQEGLLVVDMSDTQVGKGIPKTFGLKQDQLRILLLDETSLNDIGLCWVCASFPNLEVLSLKGTNVTNQSSSCLERLPQLRDLDVCKTAVDKGIFESWSLEFLNQVNVVRMDAAAISTAYIELLESSHPTLRVQISPQTRPEITEGNEYKNQSGMGPSILLPGAKPPLSPRPTR